MKPTIISDPSIGEHAADLAATVERLTVECAYKDLSTVLIVPAFMSIPTRIVASWWSMMFPPNQKVAKLFAQGMEVGAAYSQTIEGILGHAELSAWKYVLTLEHDNAPPADGAIKLLAQMEAHPEFAAIGGLYFTKGRGGVAQIWGDVNSHPINFRPQRPRIDGGLQECNGLGMGFTAFRMSLFKDKRLRRPWFKTTASREEGLATQDLYAWNDFRANGYRCAVDCSVRVGHWDDREQLMW